jgi:plasmid maintenance system antidote protein VapI
MSPERTRRLIAETKAWLEVNGVKQKGLAAKLGMTPQQLNNVLREYRQFTGEQALHLQEIIGTKAKSRRRAR